MRGLGKIVLWVMVVIGVAIGVARAVAIRWWRVPSDDPYLEASISPTLRGGDLVILWRLSSPLVTDLVVCPEPQPEDEEGSSVRDDSRIVIGRIVADHGDNVAIKKGYLYVNHKKLGTESACDEREFETIDPETGNEMSQFCDMEEIGNKVHMRGNLAAAAALPNDLDDTDINEGQVFLASDNRQFPYDSRDYGAVDQDTCKESIVFRLTSKEGFFDVDKRLTYIR